MKNKEIFNYELPISQIGTPGPTKVLVQETCEISPRQDFAILVNLPTDICLVTKIGKYNLSRFLMLTAIYEGGLVFVENQEFNIWGEGKTLDGAIKSFEEFFLYDFKSYKNITEKKMDFAARRQLKSYKEILNIP